MKNVLARITAVSLLRNLPVLKRSVPVDHGGTYLSILKKGPKPRKVYISFFSPASGLKPHDMQITVDEQKFCLLCFLVCFFTSSKTQMRLKSSVADAWLMCLDSSQSDVSEQPVGQTSPHQTSQLYDIKRGE